MTTYDPRSLKAGVFDDDLDLRMGRVRLAAGELLREAEAISIAARQSPSFGPAFADQLDAKLAIVRDVLGLPPRPGTEARA